MSKTKTDELDAFILESMQSSYYGSGLSPAAMRDSTHKKSRSYRALEEACSEVLTREGAIFLHWRKLKDARRDKNDRKQFDFGDLPNPIPEFAELKRKYYVPFDDEDAESDDEDASGQQLEPQKMTYNDWRLAADYNERLGRGVIRRSEVCKQMCNYYDALGIPHEWTLEEWKRKGCPKGTLV